MARPAPKLALLGGIAAYAALVLVSGLDRASASSPALAAFVPAPFAAQAQRSAAQQALQDAQHAPALAAATRAVIADPIDPRSAALLGAAQLADQQRVKADRSFRVAAQFGWRDPLTQLYFMNAALAGGQPRLAALRLDAILRQSPDFPLRNTLLAQFEGTAEGRTALAERLALRPAWSFAYMNHIGLLELPTLRNRAAVVASLGAGQWGCDSVAPLTAHLATIGGPIEAKQLWQAHCPAAAIGIADPQFAAIRLARRPVPFEWNLVGSGDVEATPAAQTGTGQTGLLVRVGGPVPQPIAWQMLTLPPGTYELSWTARNGQSAATGVQVSLSCTLTDRRAVTATANPDGKGRFTAQLAIDAACPGHILALWQAPGPDLIRFDDLAITPR